MYSEQYRASLEAVAKKRAENVALEPVRMTAEQKESLLKTGIRAEQSPAPTWVDQKGYCSLAMARISSICAGSR